jgi:hypothetical protein
LDGNNARASGGSKVGCAPAFDKDVTVAEDVVDSALVVFVSIVVIVVALYPVLMDGVMVTLEFREGALLTLLGRKVALSPSSPSKPSRRSWLK